MAAFLGFTIAITLVMWLAPETDAGKLLHRQLVERPLNALARFERHHLWYIVIFAGFAVGGGEMALLLGSEYIAVFAMDLAIYFDAVLVTYAASTLATMRRSGSWLCTVFSAPLRRVMPRRKRAADAGRPERKAANDDDRPAVFALAG